MVFNAKHITELREEAALTKWKLGKLSGIDPCYVTRIERGEQIPSVAILCKIADALGVLDMNVFFDE